MGDNLGIHLNENEYLCFVLDEKEDFLFIFHFFLVDLCKDYKDNPYKDSSLDGQAGIYLESKSSLALKDEEGTCK